MKKVYYIGLDVHKDNTEMAVLEMKGKEPAAIKVIDSDPLKVAKAILPYQKEGTVQVAYEAGCMGYTLYRVLTGMKIDRHRYWTGKHRRWMSPGNMLYNM